LVVHILWLLFIFISCLAKNLDARSCYRLQYDTMPEITTRWLDEPEGPVYRLKSFYIKEYPLFTTFDREHVNNHLLPEDKISYRNEPEKSISPSVLTTILEQTLEDIYKYDKKPPSLEKHFIILKKLNFDWKSHAGLLVIKFKEYPIVVKLFMETPKTLVHPLSKDIQQAASFMMSGGINRYMLGFTRIKNLAALRARIATSPYWRSFVDLPRKWFWIPPCTRWFELASHNLGSKDYVLQLPSVYAIFCDAIESDDRFNLFNRHERELSLELAHFLGARIDPHIYNFMREKSTGKIVIIDTEHFPSIVGLRKPLVYKNYPSLYLQLATKFLKDYFFTSKKDRSIPIQDIIDDELKV
jgi:hypothetical protein